jgi:hypothetical protein
MAALAFYIHDRWGDRQPADESTVAVSEKAGSTGDKEGSEKLSLAREAPVRDEAGAAAKREASAEAGASEGDSQAKGTDEVKTDILSPDPNAPDVEDEAFPEATLSEDETEPELRAPSQSGRAQIIRGRALSKAIIRVDNPKGPLCKDLKKMIAEKLGLKGFSTEDFVQTVARYQMKNGLDVVGHPGPQTRKALFGYDLRRKVCAKRPKPSGDNPPE